MAKKNQTNSNQVPVQKTYKLYINGAFPRTESGRYKDLRKSNGDLIANLCWASRKDFRNAVVAARKAQAGWHGRTAYNRSQIIYRMAEMLQQKESLFVDEMLQMGYSEKAAKTEFDESVEYLVYYAGWCDKYVQVYSTVNPVSGSYFNFSLPEPMGVVAAMASDKTALIGFLEAIIPVIVSGNAVVVLASEKMPVSAMSFAEVLATSDLPGGVINILTGNRSELLMQFASHMDVNAFLIWDASSADAIEIGGYAAENVKRIKMYESAEKGALSLKRITDTVEVKTTWHPIERIASSGKAY